jgi:tetratricopeptide (TPR) repeat protein
LWRATPHHLSPNAVYWYDQGTNALRDGSYYKASKALERAIQLDNKFALAHARLAEAWTELDYTDKAKDEIIRAETLVPDHSILPPVEALYLQAITKTVLGELAPAIESYREIVRRSPDREKPRAYVDLGRAYEKNSEPSYSWPGSLTAEARRRARSSMPLRRGRKLVAWRTSPLKASLNSGMRFAREATSARWRGI